MERLSSAAYSAVRPLVPRAADAGHMAFAHAVLDGAMPGLVLADRTDEPRSAFVCNLAGFWFALGEANEAFTAEALPELLAAASEEETGLWATSREWERILSRHFAVKRWRTEFHFDPATAVQPPALPPRMRLVPLDIPVLERWGDGIDPWVVETLGGAASFMERSFGFGVVDDEQLLSFCAGCAFQADGEREVEIEIGTSPFVREVGLGAIVARAFIDECANRHLLPAWTCASDNVPSERLAIRSGFRPVRKIAGFPVRAGMRKAGRLWV